MWGLTLCVPRPDVLQRVPVRNIDGGKPREYRGYGAEIREVAWSPDDALILGTGGNNAAVVWDVASAVELPELTGHSDIVGFAAWDRTG